MRVLGIDPGTAITGFGVLDSESGKTSVVTYGCIRTIPSSDEKRLSVLYRDLSVLIKKFRPDFASVEKLFVQKNVRTVMTVSQARGVILLCLENAHIPLYEYTPLQVKQALTGYGRADKKQVQEFIRSILCLSSVPKPDDAADALAVACCHVHSMSFLQRL